MTLVLVHGGLWEDMDAERFGPPPDSEFPAYLDLFVRSVLG